MTNKFKVGDKCWYDKAAKGECCLMKILEARSENYRVMILSQTKNVGTVGDTYTVYEKHLTLAEKKVNPTYRQVMEKLDALV